MLKKATARCLQISTEMLMAYQTGMVGLHARVKVRMYAGENDTRGKLVESTVGRFIFNQKIPQDLGLCRRQRG